jgi:hypothetical protein
MTHSVAKRSLTSTRHVKRTTQAKAIIREFVEAFENRSLTLKARGRLDWIRDAANFVAKTVSNTVDTGATNQVKDALQDDANAVTRRVQDDGLHQPGNSTGEFVETAPGTVRDPVGLLAA